VLREPTPKLVRYLACTGQAAVLLIPLQATGQQANFEIKADVRVREDSFACKEISELYGSKVLINACKPHQHLKEFPQSTLLRRSTYDRVAERWQELGFSGSAPSLNVFHPE
jgi:hypothetical protein